MKINRKGLLFRYIKYLDYEMTGGDEYYPTNLFTLVLYLIFMTIGLIFCKVVYLMFWMLKKLISLIPSIKYIDICSCRHEEGVEDVYCENECEIEKFK